MFNPFKKSQPKTEQVAVAGKYPDIVHEIHNEFLSASDKILEEANRILCEAKIKSTDKGKRLAAIGFSKTPEASEAINAENTIVKTKEIADVVEHFKINYPLNKFITEEQVKAICKKYGLVCAPTTMYKGFVPEKNLTAIERFKIKKEDAGLNTSNGLFFANAEIRQFGGYYHIFKITEKSNHIYSFQSENGVDFYSSDRKDIFGLSSIGDQRFSIEPTALLICAPLRDMEIPPTHSKGDYKIERVYIPDPVVLHPVKNGYLIVTAWGDEASDENVVNEKMN